ncbi:cytochrome P450 [Halorubrum distributum]|uniref:Cytochrome P450 n=4 Tax=Halorubrum distributum TaxID=29283 RepID=M0NSC5_9EURY|nr:MULTISPECIES: cytochrome P450 [Halorubrum distributum group]ELZ31242.1 cytochrome P450 [Halorubrum terrestre JCM 10247]EMA60478.1 cytochrome P450 [Halorubrum litoreum JCM 13561]EMA70614.1 cytochrome P450 [Halorubrum arcis JCM 13916]MYL16502.1 cytochrome P450 [Halorubrum terrestre]MYL67442.1 cytochrome P450 [Halorubrum terrestre]
MSVTPPGPLGDPLFGNGRQFADDPFGFLRACADSYGDVVRLDLGPRETYLLTNPADVERVLVADAERYRKPQFGDDAMDTLLGDGLLMSEGETWQRQRKLANPAFHNRRIGALAGVMADHAESHVADWEDGDVVDLQLELARLTVKIIVTAMFGADIDDEEVKTVQENLEPLGARFEPDPRRYLIPDWLPTRENREFDAAIDTLESVIDGIVERRRGTERDPSVDPAGPDGTGVRGPPGDPDADLPMDLLSVLLRARDRGEQTDENLRDELVTMLLAGHDTTALALTYAFYLLSNHPEARERVEGEAEEAVSGGSLTAGAVRDMDYTERVLNESMRLYPPVYTLFREPKLDVKLGGYRIPEGSALMVSQWVIHRSERWYDDPEAFDPDRWTPERRSQRPRFAYFPFGGGPRHCIGKAFSLLEAKIILATVCSRFELDYEGPSLALRGSLTMHPNHPVPMRIRER